MKLKNFFNSLVSPEVLGLLIFSICLPAQADSFLTTIKDKIRSSISSTNEAVASTNSPAKIDPPVVSTSTISTNRVKMDTVTYEQARNDGAKESNKTTFMQVDRLPAPEDSTQLPLNFLVGFDTPPTQYVFEKLSERVISPTAKSTLEFKGKSQAGHEFKLVITGRKVEATPLLPNTPGQNLILDVAIYFDGAGPIPLLGRLYPTFTGAEEGGASFSGLLVSSVSAHGKTITLDQKSDVNLNIDYDDGVGKFQLKRFSLKASALTANPLPDTNETIATGGLDSGGGK